MNPTKPMPAEAELRKQLTKDQYHVTRECGTETPFHNAYWDNHKAGIYVDIITGEPLFSSLDKFDSGTGWPSFTKPISPDNVVEKRDSSHGMERTEVRGKMSDSHLGHVFDDGPAADRRTLLCELRVAAFYSCREAEGRRLRSISLALSIATGPATASTTRLARNGE